MIVFLNVQIFAKNVQKFCSIQHGEKKEGSRLIPLISSVFCVHTTQRFGNV